MKNTQNKKVSHLFCMDDLKMIGKTKEELQKLILAVRKISYVVDTEIGLSKLKKFERKKGKLVNSHTLIFHFNRG